MKPLVRVQNVSKNYQASRSYKGSKHSQTKVALNDISFELYPGQILGLLGHNGAGKSTLINALLGAHRYQGEIDINGCHPIQQHAELMLQLAYISDVNVLPDWMSVKQILKYTAGVHPSFDIDKAIHTLARTQIDPSSKIKSLSKGMKVQLHLAIVIATDSKVLILDEPTLGLDLLYRDVFYRHLLEWFHDGERALIIASHEVSEIEHLLTDVVMLKQGKAILQGSMEKIGEDYFILEADQKHSEIIESLNPLNSQISLGTVKCLLKSDQLSTAENWGNIHRASLADLFIALQKEDV
ncbi:ABC transporter ATP-binding protein [Vibrio sp. TH_r3]|uniref:ABC transporter ATP-binding protein n=1 Tax=Vibrio sp. TH_r3 TaxID=3082084 RepID=UPI00295422DC|nr:ABC transporter ATP-binding protein [Vibrio sp. TH_r3]MDV7103865.1 ABC transporter ATP-binding protein [Vibrio sp. TH_r3]